MAFKLSKEMQDRIKALVSDLQVVAGEMQDEWDYRSERWQESDAGNEATTWIEQLNQAADDLEALPAKPE